MPSVDLHSAPLLRFWIERGLLDPGTSTRDLGVRLGDWLSVRHAIQLRPLLDASPSSQRHAPGLAAETWRAEFDQMVADLRAAILHDRFASGLWRNPMPAGVILHPLVWDELWEPYRRYLSDHQKQMNLWLGRWRKKLRAALLTAGGDMQVLARLDAVYGDALADKETRLLATLPLRMGQHLNRLVRQHLVPSSEPTTGRSASSPPWLSAFEVDLRASLMAELELRSQPLLGLLEAMESK
jgi:Protein of unknown function (DUF3348)